MNVGHCTNIKPARGLARKNEFGAVGHDAAQNKLLHIAARERARAGSGARAFYAVAGNDFVGKDLGLAPVDEARLAECRAQLFGDKVFRNCHVTHQTFGVAIFRNAGDALCDDCER